MFCQFLLYSKVNQLYVYIYPLFFGFPSHLGHHRALSRAPCALQQVLISYLFYTQQCIYVNPSLPVHPTPPPPWCPYVCFLCLRIYFCFVHELVSFFQIPHICVNIQHFFKFIFYTAGPFQFFILYILIYCICLSLSDLLHLV